MNILDSSAWIEVLNGSAIGEPFMPLLKTPLQLIVPATVLTEVRKVMLQQGTPVKADVATKTLLTCQFQPIDAQLATQAADLSVKHQLPHADSLIYATTLTHQATLWTLDNHFQNLPQVRYFPKTKPD